MADSKPTLLSKLPTAQHHLLGFWDHLDTAAQQHLATQIADIDFAQLDSLSSEHHVQADLAALAEQAEPPQAFRLTGKNRFSAEDAQQRGQAALAEGRLGVLLVAGGQGTRLGFPHPKGMFPIGPVSGATLFEILFEKVLAVSRRYAVAVPLYVMTSPATHDETVAYLAEKHFFGLPPADVTVFCQGTMPAVEAATGKLLLAEKHALAQSPDGHGGMLAALKRSGGLDDFQRRGLRQLFYLQVDNPLVEMCDPQLLGYHLLSESELSTQVVAKQTPLDRVGNFVSIGGQARIVEYSDLPEAVAERRNADGSLALWAGNIAVHMFDADFLARAAHAVDALPFHRAKKKVPFVNEAGLLVEPMNENAIKFERFIFDLLPLARNPIAVEVDEALVFAPVKNAQGAKRDSPQTVQAQMTALHRRWLKAAGADVAGDAIVEIAPSFALDADELATKLAPGQSIAGSRYFR